MRIAHNYNIQYNLEKSLCISCQHLAYHDPINGGQLAMAFKTKYVRWQCLFCFIRQKHFCRFLPLAEHELVQMVIREVRNA